MATTTTYVDSTFSASVIGARTDEDGDAVTDLTAEEARFPAATFAAGYMTDEAFKVSAQSTPNMTVKVGSGTAKADYYCVSGDAGGQGNYVVRLDATSQNVTIGAADAAQTRTDEIYLVVQDNTYDISSKSLPRLACRKGEVGGAAPGADSTWKAYALLATVTVAAGATTITDDDIEDERTLGGPGNAPAQLVTAKGDLLVASGSGVLTRLGVGSNDQVLTADSSATNGVKWAAADPPGVSAVATFSKSSDQTTSSGTAVDVTEMSFSVAANSTYLFHMVVLYGHDAQFVFTGSLSYPSGATFSGAAVEGSFGGGGADLLTNEWGGGASSSTITSRNSKLVQGIVETSSTSGTVQLRFRANDGTTRVQAGSTGYAMKLA